MNDLNEWVRQSPFTIIAVVIRKGPFLARHAEVGNPYHVSVRDYQVAARGSDRKTAARVVTSSSRVLYFERRRSARR